jgi:hypothetical protein
MNKAPLRDYDKLTPRERRDRAILRAELQAAHVLVPAARPRDPDPASLNACQANNGSQSEEVMTSITKESVDSSVTDTDVSLRQAMVFAFLIGRRDFRSPAMTVRDATEALNAGDITGEQWRQVVYGW